MVIADVNAVPQKGINSITKLTTTLNILCGALSIGPLTSGDLKVKNNIKCLKKCANR